MVKTNVTIYFVTLALLMKSKKQTNPIKTKFMKTMKITLMSLAVIAGMSFAACKKNKDTAKTDQALTPKDQGEVKITNYCSVREWPSTNESFRASATGASSDMETARKKALTNAQAQLASSMNTTIKAVTDAYTSSTEFNKDEERTGSFNSLTRAVVSENLAGAVTVCEEFTKSGDGYKCYIALELKGETFLNAHKSKLSQNEKLKADYNYEKFKDTFNQEMEKLANEQK